jgi:hypothetical protein
VSLTNRASFNNNEQGYTVSSSSSSRAGIELSRADIERAVKCVGMELKTFYDDLGTKPNHHFA